MRVPVNCIKFSNIVLSFFKLTKNQKTYLNYLIKIVIVGLAVWFIYNKVSNQHNLRQFNTLVRELESTSVQWALVIVVLFMFINWMLEVVKWRYLSSTIQKISFWTATKSVFCGLTWAIFTPNRIGEFGGRVMLLKPKNRAKAAVAMGVGQFAQLVLTSIFGALSIAWFVSVFIPAPTSVLWSVWLLAIIYAGAFLILYFNVHWIDHMVGKMNFLQKIKPFFEVLEDYTSSQLWRVLLLSLTRFVIFTSQYVILMLVILPELPLVPMVLMIFILFFVQSALPTLDIFDFSVRSFVASNLYGYITSQEIAVMAIVSFIWFVNLILPAIIGAFFVMNVNYLGGDNS